MGNTTEKNKYSTEYGGILIRLDNTLEYFPGDTVSGQIYLEIKKPFPGNQIILQIKGREKVMWELQFRRDHTDYIETHWGKKYFYNNSVVIFQFNGSEIGIGQYMFPFSFVLQQFLPPTFLWEKDKKDYAKNDYRLIAKLASFDSKINFHHHETFFVKSQLFLIPGNNAQVIIEMDNSQGSIDIKSIKCQIKQKLELHAPHEKVRAKYAINSLGALFVSSGPKQHTFSWDIDGKQLAGVKANQKATGDQKMLVDMHLNEDKHNFPTFQSEYIKNSYFLEVQGDVDGCTCCGCCGPIPEIMIPISVANSVDHQVKFYKQKTQQFELDLQQQYQQNWNPQVQPNQQLIFNNNNFVSTETQNEMHNYNYNYNPMMQQMNNQNAMKNQDGYMLLQNQQ